MTSSPDNEQKTLDEASAPVPTSPSVPDEQEAAATQAEAPSPSVAAAPDSTELELYRPELGQIDPRDPQGVYATIDKYDEDMIVQELQGKALETMLYSFEGNVDLSYAGVSECIRQMNTRGAYRIAIDPDRCSVEEVTEDGQEWYVATVYAFDAATGTGFVGTSQQPKRMQLKPDTAKKLRNRGKPVDENNTLWDQFARVKALNKAQRNAFKPHIPFEMREHLIATLKGDQSKIRRIRTGIENVEPAPPALTDDRAKELVAECRRLFTDIKAIDPLQITPAQFNKWLTGSQHDHERLEDFVMHLKALRANLPTEAS